MSISSFALVGHTYLPCAHVHSWPIAQYDRIMGTREYSADLPQGGLEIPCVLTFECDKEVTKIRKPISKNVEPIDRKPDIQPLSKKRYLDLHITATYGQSETHGSTPWLT